MTFDPCNGCKGEHQSYSSTSDGVETTRLHQRKKGALCRHCARQLDRAGKIIALHNAASETVHQQVHHRQPRVRALQLRQLLGWHSGVENAVSKAIAGLAEVAGLPVAAEGFEASDYLVPYERHEGSGATYSPSRLYSREQIEAFGVFVEAIEAALKAAYETGHEAGADLLARLATGDLTVFDYDAERARVRAEAVE